MCDRNIIVGSDFILNVGYRYIYSEINDNDWIYNVCQRINIIDNDFIYYVVNG
jgi:hypothetical protein